MKPFILNRPWLLLTAALSCMLLFSPPAHAGEDKPKHSGQAAITHVMTNILAGEVYIFGTNLMDEHSPKITLGDQQLVVISGNGDLISAYLPNGLTDGDYQLKISGKKEKPPLVYDLTIGAVGPQGPAGPTGPQGPAGAKGATGAQGVAGATGAIGPRGARGMNWKGVWDIAAQYRIDDSVSYQGSSYIAISDNFGTLPDTAPLIWQLLASKGSPGVAGADGATGPQGPAGADGAVGPQGLQGIPGPAGPQGLTGATGPQGPAGADGATGPQGLQGIPGPAGLTGLTGATGPQGPTGPAGAPGADATGVYINVKDFGAVGDGVTDDTVAIQKAIDSIGTNLISLTQPIYKGGTVFFPQGDYAINAPIRTYSAIALKGAGPSSRIMEGSGFGGDALIWLITPGSYPAAMERYQGGEISDLSFRARGVGIAAIRQHTIRVLNSHFHKLYFDTPYGVMVNSYTQKCLFEDFYSVGPLEQFIHLKGNDNIIQNIDQEGGSGTSTEPFIKIERHVTSRSGAIFLRNILLEGAGSPNKSYLELNGCTQCVINGIWGEANASDGYLIRLIDSDHIQIKGSIVSVTDTKRIKVDRTRGVVIDNISTDGVGGSLWSYLEVDNQSFVRIKNLETRRGGDLYKLQAMQNVVIDQHIVSRLSPTSSLANPGQQARSQLLLLAGQNLLMNPSFEAGSYGWLFSGSGGRPSGENYIASEVGSGKMADYTWASGTSVIYQFINIPPSLVGRAMTFSIKARIESKGFLSPYVAGAGINSSNGFHSVWAGSGWQVLTQTVIPQSAGQLAIGVRTAATGSSTELFLDDASFGFGTVGTTNLGKFASIELGVAGGNTLTYAVAAPNQGAWKKGDLIFNSSPATGASVGWVCITAGTPGVWKSFGTIN
jgi:hypothetical protein